MLASPAALSSLGNGSHDIARNAVRTFALSRIRNAAATAARFQRPPDFDPKAHLSSGLSVMTGSKDYHVIIELDAWAADISHCRTLHPTQRIVQLPGGGSDANTFIVDEHAERLWLPQRHASAIRSTLARHGISLSGSQPSTFNSQPHLSRFVAGADLFSRQSDGTTIAQQYAREGIHLRPANMDRINGWAEILQRLGDPAASITPRLFIHQRCGRLIDTLPSLQHDPNRPEDVLKVDADEDGIGGGDSADALRYLIATKPRSITQKKLTGL